MAEPGLLFWDNIINESPADCYKQYGFESISTNPCITKDTWILTNRGPKQVVDLINKCFNAIVNGKVCHDSKLGFFKNRGYGRLENGANALFVNQQKLPISRLVGWKVGGGLVEH